MIQRLLRFCGILSVFLLVATGFSGCSKRMKGYSATLRKSSDAEQGSGVNPAVVYDDEEFFDLIAKIESGEFEPEPVRQQEIPDVPQPIIEVPEGKTIEIKEKLFLTQINDIYFNFENYKEKKVTNLERMAKRIAREVKVSKVETKLEPMNSYERRVIHNALSKNKYVYTESVGEEPNRCVVIKLKEEVENK